LIVIKILVTGKNGQLGRSIHKLVNTGNGKNNYQQDNEFIFAGVARPTSVSVDTYGTVAEGLNDDVLSTFVIERFSLTPNWITKKFALDKPSAETFLYADIEGKAQVGQSDYPWEKLDNLKLFSELRN
jgi:S-adenosylmethionine synthetase